MNLVSRMLHLHWVYSLVCLCEPFTLALDVLGVEGVALVLVVVAGPLGLGRRRLGLGVVAGRRGRDGVLGPVVARDNVDEEVEDVGEGDG